MTGLTDTVGNGNKRGFLRTRRGDNSGLPGELKVETAVGSRDEEDETDVAGGDVEGADKHGAAGGGEDDGDDDVPEGFLEVAAGPGDGAGGGVGDGVWRCLDEVGL